LPVPRMLFAVKAFSGFGLILQQGFIFSVH